MKKCKSGYHLERGVCIPDGAVHRARVGEALLGVVAIIDNPKKLDSIEMGYVSEKIRGTLSGLEWHDFDTIPLDLENTRRRKRMIDVLRKEGLIK